MTSTVLAPIAAGRGVSAPTTATVPRPTAVPITPPDGVPHLVTPENLPPGTTQAPTRTGSGTRGYLKDIWEAMRSGEVSTAEALMLIAQRPMTGTALQDMTPQQSATPAPDAALPAPAAEAVPAAEAPLSPVPSAEAPLPQVIPAADEPVLVPLVTP